MGKDYYERRKVKQGDFTYLVDDDDLTAWISEGHSNGESVLALPESVELEGKTFQIRSIEIGAYCGEASLEELFIPDCYEFIDEDAFRGCEKLKSVHIGKSLERYCKWSFNGSPLEKLDIDPENPFMKVSDDGCSILSKDGKIMMYNFIQKEILEIQSGVEELSECAVSCNDISMEITFPESLRKLDSNAIFECHSVGKLIFKDGLEEAGPQSLSWNGNLREIDFPPTFRRLGYEAITEDRELRKIILRSPDVVEIDAGRRYDALENCPTETCTLYVPEGLVEAYRSHPAWGRFRHMVSLYMI